MSHWWSTSATKSCQAGKRSSGLTWSVDQETSAEACMEWPSNRPARRLRRLAVLLAVGAIEVGEIAEAATEGDFGDLVAVVGRVGQRPAGRLQPLVHDFGGERAAVLLEQL